MRSSSITIACSSRVFGARRVVGAHSHSSMCAVARSDLPAPRRSHCPALARLYRYMWQRPRAEAELAAKAAVVPKMIRQDARPRRGDARRSEEDLTRRLSRPAADGRSIIGCCCSGTAYSRRPSTRSQTASPRDKPLKAVTDLELKASAQTPRHTRGKLRLDPH
jgi:hypothetical protein